MKEYPMRVLKAALDTLADLEAAYRRNPTPALRIAVKWAKRASTALWDQMFRYSVLEGVAGLPEGSQGMWSDNPRKAPARIQEALRGFDIHEDWLGSANTGLYKAVSSAVENYMKRSGVEGVTGLTPEEVVQNGYMGLGRFSGTRKRVLPLVGKSLANEIKGGAPPRKAIGMASKYFENMASNEVKAYRRQKDRHRIDYSGEGGTEDRGVVDKALWDKNRSLWFARLMFDPNDPLGRKIIKWVYTFLGKQKGGKYLQKWFEMSLKARRPVKQDEVAREFGMKPTGLGRYFPPVLGSRSGRPGSLELAFWKSPLAEELFDRFVDEGGVIRQAGQSPATRLSVIHQFRSFFRVS